MLGVQRSSVPLCAHTLQKSGLIQYSRGNIKSSTAVVSKKSLANVAPSFANALTATVGPACVTSNRTHDVLPHAGVALAIGEQRCGESLGLLKVMPQVNKKPGGCRKVLTPRSKGGKGIARRVRVVSGQRRTKFRAGLADYVCNIARADPGDHGQLERDDGEGDRGRDVEMGNEIR
jgi:hypothetical protein